MRTCVRKKRSLKKEDLPDACTPTKITASIPVHDERSLVSAQKAQAWMASRTLGPGRLSLTLTEPREYRGHGWRSGCAPTPRRESREGTQGPSAPPSDGLECPEAHRPGGAPHSSSRQSSPSPRSYARAALPGRRRARGSHCSPVREWWDRSGTTPRVPTDGTDATS